MPKDLSKYGQYKNDIFNKMGFAFKPGSKLLDVGCGEGSDAEIFIKEFKLDVYGTDIYEDEKVKSVEGLKFQIANISQLPFEDNFFDYVFIHDVLHHVDEKNQSLESHLVGLKELQRVCKNYGNILILEGNRYNPLFYPHMVLLKKHNHFAQKYFKYIIEKSFPDYKLEFFECHLYPKSFFKLFKIYEKFMEKFSFLRPFLAYNFAIIKNKK